MRKGLKVLSMSLLLTSLFVTGCGGSDDEKVNVSRIENKDQALLKGLSEDASDYTLQDVYNALIANGVGNTAVANKIVELIADNVLEIKNSNKPWKTRYENLVDEKMKEVASADTYLVKGEFSENYFVEALKAEGYNITCAAGDGDGTVDDLTCDYNDYINKNIRVNALTTLLKEKYVQDEVLSNRANLFTSKKIRDVEYFTISSSLDSSYEDLSVRDFARAVRDRIANKEVVNFSGEQSIENDIKEQLKNIVDVEYKKIDTSNDYSQSIAAKYTNNFTQEAFVGFENKIKEIDDGEYAFSKMISSDSENTAIISQNITSTLLSITDPTSDDFKRKVVPVTDTAGNTYYYLVNANAGATVDSSDVLLSETSDSSTYVYSFVRFRVINSDTTDETDVYNAIKLIASESTLGNGALAHYVKENKDLISVYDDEVKAYLETLYPDVFAE